MTWSSASVLCHSSTKWRVVLLFNMDNGAFTRRNQAAPCRSLAIGMLMIQLLQTDSLSYSTKPETRRRVGTDKTLSHLPRTPGLRGWNLMLQSQAQYVSLFELHLMTSEHNFHLLKTYDLSTLSLTVFLCLQKKWFCCVTASPTQSWGRQSHALWKYCPFNFLYILSIRQCRGTQGSPGYLVKLLRACMYGVREFAKWTSGCNS
jgi:hypothetical protein